MYLDEYQLVPMARLTELLDALFGLTIGVGTVNNLLARCSDRLEDFEARAIEVVRAALAAHFDESGVRVGGKLHWLHVASTLFVTCHLMHGKRGIEAMRRRGALEGYKGYAVHDHWGPYFAVEGLLHVLCNAHHIRELVYVHEQYGQPSGEEWAVDPRPGGSAPRGGGSEGRGPRQRPGSTTARDRPDRAPLPPDPEARRGGAAGRGGTLFVTAT